MKSEQEETSSATHCGSPPKKIAIGLAPLGLISIGIVPMGIISIGVVPMGVVSLGVVAMGVINASVVGMGVLSAGITTMGIWEWSPPGRSHVHQIHNNSHRNHKQHDQTSNNFAYRTQEEAKAKAKQIGCQGIHRMGSLWMPCSIHTTK